MSADTILLKMIGPLESVLHPLGAPDLDSGLLVARSAYHYTDVMLLVALLGLEPGARVLVLDNG